RSRGLPVSFRSSIAQRRVVAAVLHEWRVVGRTITGAVAVLDSPGPPVRAREERTAPIKLMAAGEEGTEDIRPLRFLHTKGFTNAVELLVPSSAMRCQWSARASASRGLGAGCQPSKDSCRHDAIRLRRQSCLCGSWIQPPRRLHSSRARVRGYRQS